MKNNYMKKALYSNKLLIIGFILLNIINAFFTVQLMERIGLIMDIESFNNMKEFYKYAFDLIIVMGINMLMYILCTSVSNISKKKISYNIKFNLFDLIMNKSISKFNTDGQDAIISMFVNDIPLIEQNYISVWFTLIEKIILLITSLIVLFMTNWLCSIIVVVLCTFPIMLPSLMVPKLQKKMELFSKENVTFFSKTNELLEGFEVYKNYNATNVVKNEFEKVNNQLSVKKYKAFKFMDILTSVASVSGITCIMGILITGMFLSLKGYLTVGQVFAIMFISGGVLEPLSSLSQYLPKLLSSKTIIQKYNNLMNKVDSNGKIIEKLDNEISIKNLSLKFQDKKILNNINLKIEKGKKYAFIGESGSGKSTLLKAILGYYDNYDGDIKIDNIDEKEINMNTIFNSFTYVTQSPILFSGTIKDNITVFNDSYSNKEISTVIEKCMLNEKIDSLDNGVNNIFTEDGKNFSGGEKQRVVLARALLKKNDILIMDEATSALDNNNYLNIENMLLNIPDTTILSATHRINKSILSEYDNIFVLKNGVIIEEGTFDKLLENKGYFNQLYSAQIA